MVKRKGYEYKVLRLSNQPVEDIEKILNQAGRDGWELRSYENNLYVFIRHLDMRYKHNQ